MHGCDKDIDHQYTEIVCQTKLGLRKNAADHIKTYPHEVGVYDKLMRYWIRTELGVEIPCIKEVMERSCWGCGEEKEGLKHCKGEIIKYLG